MTRAPLSVAVTLVLSACLEPRVSDEVSSAGQILPAGTVLPSLDEDPVLGPQIEAADGFEGTIPLLTGFAGGRPVRWWDFGPAPDHAAPLYVLVRRGTDGNLAPIGHPAIVGRIPGDEGYTPFWALTFVEVTAAYADQVIPSVAAMQEARELGLLERPDGQDLNVNCPIVAADVRLEVGEGRAPIAPPGTFYYEGRAGRYFEFGPTPLAEDGVSVPIGELYVVRREGGEPLSEPERRVDMTGDGDLRDTNDVFGDAVTPLLRVVSVTVKSGTKLVDTSGDQEISDVNARADLFDDAGGAVAATVVAFEPTTRVVNAQLAPEATP